MTPLLATALAMSYYPPGYVPHRDSYGTDPSKPREKTPADLAAIAAAADKRARKYAARQKRKTTK